MSTDAAAGEPPLPPLSFKALCRKEMYELPMRVEEEMDRKLLLSKTYCDIKIRDMYSKFVDSDKKTAQQLLAVLGIVNDQNDVIYRQNGAICRQHDSIVRLKNTLDKQKDQINELCGYVESVAKRQDKWTPPRFRLAVKAPPRASEALEEATSTRSLKRKRDEGCCPAPETIPVRREAVRRSERQAAAPKP